ncbi:MAG: glycosyltransferase family 4 protein [Anaerolineae bacterium]|nr:glycosyltransferase family 4 protein [Anaerolineae bacterium]
MNRAISAGGSGRSHHCIGANPEGGLCYNHLLMRICLISVEIFAWGKYGGFGRATRLIGRELVKRGVEVYAVVPRRNEQRPVEDLDGIRVLGFEPRDLRSAYRLLRDAQADIYHSQEPSLGAYLALRAQPDRKHIITFRDPRDLENWRIEFRMPSLNSFQVITNWLYEDNFLVGRAVHRADGLFAASHLVAERARGKYRLDRTPEFLPTPVDVPAEVQKAEQPTACLVSRWDRRKRPELFFELARQFPEVRFLAAGKSRDPDYECSLREAYERLPNLEMLGFIDQFNTNRLMRTLEKSWILVNPAAREGLPNAYIEAAAHGCAILSAVDPDGFTSRFGYHVTDDDFASGLTALLKDDRWRTLGEEARRYVSEVFATKRAIDQHLAVYERTLG